MSAEDLLGGERVGVVVPLPLEGVLDYLKPPEMGLSPGDFVSVDVGPRAVIGVVWDAPEGRLPAERLRPIAGRLDVPRMRCVMRRFLDRAATYTMNPLGMMLWLATRVPDLGAPARTRRVWVRTGADPERSTEARARVLAALDTLGGAGLATAELSQAAGVSSGVVTGLAKQGVLAERLVAADPSFPPLFGQAIGQHLSTKQAEAAGTLRHALAAGGFSATLLKGVTGSGKTEVYLEAVAECIARERQALVLVPEVALTPAFLARVEQRFGARPAEWHHGIGARERRRVWHAVASGAAQLVVGARSALFLPFASLGLIVIDEEHDPSFKQEDLTLYNARDMAVLRASLEGAAAVLASATPSLESWANAASGKYRRIDLPERFGSAKLPQIALIDLRLESPGRNRWISEPLADAVRERLSGGEQALLFLNRRGYAPLTICHGCGHRFGCPDCDACLVTHRYRAVLMCHQCGHQEPLPRACPACGRDDRLSVCGPGVERLAEEAAELFPDARLDVLSSDLTEGPTALKDRLAAIAAGAVDLVIGTQMVAKGHNFPNLTLVGVIDADLGLQGGDLRAAERTFQLLHQVSGRAGRAERAGTALVQTTAPDHPVMRAILSGDAEGFWRAEAAARERAGMPPYGRLAGVIVSGTDEAKVWESARALGRAAPALTEIGAEVYGPAAAPIARIRGRARARLLVKAPKGVALQDGIRRWRKTVKVPSSVRVVVDIDPQSFF
ncbi:MAG: primosomal protein N' [Pseudomonadota bacterium]